MPVKRSAARLFTGGLFIGVLLLSACAAPLQSERLATSDFPQPVELTSVVFFPQDDYQCGPAALAMALDWAGVKTSADALVPEVYLPERQGSLQLELIASARRHGTVPYVLRPKLADLLAEVAAGEPVIVLQNLGLSWFPRWHYAVVVGFDLERDEIVLRSGREARHILPLETFEYTWRRSDYWAVVIASPDKIPRTAEELPYLQSVVALERLQLWDATSTAYRAALARWPDSLLAQLGLGNSRYALNDLAGAEAAYRTATSAHPDAGVAFNNLAQTLADQQRWQEAEVAVQRALALGGPHAEAYRETLAEIQARRAKTN